MRTISRISAAFRLIDSYGKGAVTGASILVDGGRVPYVAKGDGTYVFSNLPATPHTYTITATGYRPVRRRLPVVPDHLPEVVLMQYEPGAPALGRISYFHLRFLEQGAPLGNAAIRVTLTTPVGALRVVEGDEKGAWRVSLAGGYAAGMLYQYCSSRQEGTEVLITGYDQAAGQFTLQEPLAAPLGTGTLLRPVWNLETDRDGAAILPAIGLFLQREEVELSFSWDGREQTLVTAPPSPSLRATVEF